MKKKNQIPTDVTLVCITKRKCHKNIQPHIVEGNTYILAGNDNQGGKETLIVVNPNNSKRTWRISSERFEWVLTTPKSEEQKREKELLKNKIKAIVLSEEQHIQNIKGICMDAIDDCHKHVNLICMGVNAIAASAMTDAFFVLQKTKHYRHDVKQHAKAAKQAYESFENRLSKQFGISYDIYMDFLDNIETSLKGDVAKLYFSMKNLLDKNKIKESELIAHVETARTLIEYACVSYDRLVVARSDNLHRLLHEYLMQHPDCPQHLRQKVQAKSTDLSGVCCHARMTDAYHHWCCVADKVCKIDKVVDAQHDPNCVLAFRVIENKLTSDDFFGSRAYKAILDNKDCCKASAEELEIMEREYGSAI